MKKALVFVMVLIGVRVFAGVPRTEDEGKARVEELRKEYAPYLRSLPKPLNARTRQELESEWVSTYEVEQAKDGDKKPKAPKWFVEEFDDAGWEPTTVPEWRYKTKKRRHAASCILWYRTKFNADLPEKGKRTFLVFEGVDWEAEVWLNGKFLGSHKTYYEPFRFDVTDVLKKENTLAVRVIDGPEYGEPGAYWSQLPLVPAEHQRIVRDRSQSYLGSKNGDLHCGSGYGIHREVYLETTGDACLKNIFVRGYPEKSESVINAEIDVARRTKLSLYVQIMPENFEGKSYETSVKMGRLKGEKREDLEVAMPGARFWTPETPYLYRCRVTLKDGDDIIDAKDTLFGYRSFDMVSKLKPKEGFRPGMLLLNGDPVFLRGTNIRSLNALWYWGENRQLVDLILMLKAANFNFVRACQHVQFYEVRELLDRLGIMSEQDQGSRYPKYGEQVWEDLVYSAGILPRVCYNNPGVVLLSYANEVYFEPEELVRATLKADPGRIVKPISDSRSKPRSKLYGLSDELWANVLDDFHTYKGWYARKNHGRIERLCAPQETDILVTVGEYGAEGLDSYETMQAYPKNWGPVPKISDDVLFGHVQVEKADSRQACGFRGEKPGNLGEYIEASQNYQADLISEHTKCWRLSPKWITGYMQFHFFDVNPAQWPKSIVSHDMRPKKAYYEMAQLNQPIVPLPVFVDEGQAMEIWVSNYTGKKYDNCFIDWEVKAGKRTFTSDQANAEVPAYDAKMLTKVSLKDVPADVKVVKVTLLLYDFSDEIAQYQREMYIGAWRK